jgi:hypothetical protein
MLRRIFEPKRKEITGSKEILQNEELHQEFYFLGYNAV